MEEEKTSEARLEELSTPPIQEGEIHSVSGKRRVLQETYETLIVGLAASLSEVCQTDDVPTLAQTLAQKINNAALNQSDWNRRRQRAKRRLSITDEFYQQEHHA